ncbi:hypothetical protein ACU4HD_42725 [Cupriavidus basilensis]
MADEFVKAARAQGIEIVAREYTSDKAVDFVPIPDPNTRHEGGRHLLWWLLLAGRTHAQPDEAARHDRRLSARWRCDVQYRTGQAGGDAVDEHVYCPQGGPVLENTGPGRQFKSDYRKR